MIGLIFKMKALISYFLARNYNSIKSVTILRLSKSLKKSIKNFFIGKSITLYNIVHTKNTRKQIQISLLLMILLRHKMTSKYNF